MKFATVFVCIALFGAHLAQAQTQTRYVRDWISVPLHTAATADSPNVVAGIASGTEVTLVQDEDRNGFLRVRTNEGVEGWIAARYLMKEPTARMQLENVNKELSELRAATADLKAQHDNIPLDKREAAQQLTELKSENERLQSDLQALQQAPDNATQLAQENIDLKKDNAALHTQIETATNEVGELRRSKNYALFREGGIAVLAGALLTLLVANLWPRKKSEWF